MKIYFDLRDWWIGLFLDEYYYYFCFMTLVLRVDRGSMPREHIPFCRALDAFEKFSSKQECEKAIDVLIGLRALHEDRLKKKSNRLSR